MLSAKSGYCEQFNFNKEYDRLQSFNNVDHVFLKAKKKLLAIQGFYFASKPDKVRCQFCGLTLNKWSSNDNPLDDHMQYSPNCSMLKRRAANIPIDPTEVDHILPPVSHDECGHGSVGASEKYAYPAYVLPAARLQTFDTWPTSLKQKPQDLVEAGFYYTGMADRVICFCCGLGLGQWEVDDVVWQEHAKHKPDCEFLKLNLDEKSLADYLSTQEGAASNYQTTVIEQDAEDSEPTANVCAVCLEKRQKVALVPCGHLLCGSCSFILEHCPHCRARIQNRLRIFF
jgi:baculoviral IAP repeat-containing protein 7/8